MNPGISDSSKGLAEVLLEEPEAYRAVLKAELKAGNSFPTAREHALASILAAEDLPEGFLSSPNNILAVEYVKALLKRGQPHQALYGPTDG